VTPPTDRLEAALLYHRLGLKVLKVAGKNPEVMGKGWQNRPTTAEDLPRWFGNGADFNVGVQTGTVSGNLADVDLDTKSAVLVADHFLPATGWTFGRPSHPRSHRLYRADAIGRYLKLVDPLLEKTDPKRATLVELRGNGRQTVFPPSRHETSGEVIEWAEFSDPARVAWDGLARLVHLVGAAALLACYAPGPGGRHDFALALGGALAHAGYPLEEAKSLVGAVAHAVGDQEVADRVRAVEDSYAKVARGEPCTDWPELSRLLGSDKDPALGKVREWLGLAKARRDGPLPWPDPIPLGEVPAVDPFPLDVFPQPFQRVALDGSQALQCPPDYIGLPLLVMASGALGASRALEVKPGHLQRASLYAIVIGPPGSTKSPALELVTAPAHEEEERLHAAWEEAMERFQAETDAYEADLKEWKKKPPKERGDPPKKPDRPALTRLTVNDATVESLVPILKENPRGVVLVRDEATAWVQSMNCYREGGKGADQQFWLSVWSGATVTVDRRKTHDQGPLRVRRPFVSVIGGMVPDKLTTLRGDRPRQRVEQDGFIDRDLFAYPDEPPVAEENWLEVSEETLGGMRRVMDRLRSLAMVPIQEGGLVKGWRPFVVKLTACGKVAWQRFTKAHAAEQNPDEFPRHLRGPWSKLRGYCARLALLLHYLRWAAGEDVGDDVDGPSVDRAVRLVAYFKSHARRVYAVMDADPRVADARKILRWVLAHGLQRFTKRDAYQGLKGTFKTVEDLEPGLATLVQHAIIRLEVTPPRGGPGRQPSPVYELNPRTHSQNSHNPHNSPDDEDGPVDDDPDPPSGPNSGNSGNCGNGSGGGITNGRPDAAEDADDLDDGGVPNSGDCGNCENTPGEEFPHQRADDYPEIIAADPFPQFPQSPELGTGYRCVRDAADLPMVMEAIDNSPAVAVDTETTGLCWRTDRVRLLTLGCATCEGNTFAYLLDLFALPPEALAPVWEALAGKDLILHNAGFDLEMLGPSGFTPSGPIHDLMILSRILTAGTRDGNALADLTERFLGTQLDKEEQKSAWGAPSLSEAQLRYAAADVLHLPELRRRLAQEIHAAGLGHTAEIERRCLPAWWWMATAGMPVDREAWGPLARRSRAERDRLRAELVELAPPRPGHLPGMAAWNLDSQPQVKEILQLLGFDVADTKDQTLAGIEHPFADRLRQYRYAKWLDGTYGETFLRFVAPDGRVYARWNQTGNEAGRSSCSAPNLQQIPRQSDYRRAFRAPPGRVLVKADFAAAHLRIAARVADEGKMLAAFQAGRDLHRLTAAALLGKAEGEVTKQDRQLAKAVAFGLLYGMGAKGLRNYAQQSYGVTLTLEEAKRHRATFFSTYPGLKRWHEATEAGRATQRETRTLGGRRRLLDPKTPLMHRLNSPVLGTEGDAAKTALALLWERRDQCPGARPVAFVHDEILVEADAEVAGQAGEWVRRSMHDALQPLIDPVPCEVEVQVGQTWGG
jgi:DNA polymerase-1